MDDQISLHLLEQVFFIGVGLTSTGKGNVQTFVVPRGATRLFLGIADGSGFGGAPGCYGDNIGAFQVGQSAMIDTCCEPPYNDKGSQANLCTGGDSNGGSRGKETTADTGSLNA